MKGFTNTKADWRSILLASVGATALFAGGALAQDDADETDPAVATTPAATATTDRDDDRIVVTGSRIRRSEFTSIAPVQIISGAVSRDIGLVDPAVILQDSTVTAGQQIDGSFAGFVLDNGPGSSTVDLRGLGAARSLVLINGRRMAPAGVEGAPFAPSINLIPGSIVERYEILLDGASSV